MVSKLRNNSVAKYIFVGGVSYMVELASILILVNIGLNEILAVAISFWIGFIIAFLLQKIFTFGNKEKTFKNIAKQSLGYGVLVLINYMLTIAFVSISQPILPVIISRTIALVATTCWNYIVYSKIIFKDRSNEIGDL